MTFTPIPKVDLWPITELSTAASDVIDQLASRLHHAAVDSDWAAASIADIYSRLPGLGASWRWTLVPTPTSNPGDGYVSVTIAGGVNARTITLSEIDADGDLHSLAGLSEGSTLVLTDDPTAPPTTAFRQYVVTSPVTDHGNWVSFSAIRVATFGSQDTPTHDTRVRLLLR